MLVYKHNVVFGLAAILLFLGITSSTIIAQQLEDVIFLEGRFDCPDVLLQLARHTADVITCFSGHVGPIVGMVGHPHTTDPQYKRYGGSLSPAICQDARLPIAGGLILPVLENPQSEMLRKG